MEGPASSSYSNPHPQLKETKPIMSAWNQADLETIAENDDLYVSPFREDGRTYGTPTRVWPLVVNGEVYVRAANGRQSRWYRAAVSQKAGRVHVCGQDHEVTFEQAGDEVASAIDAAYEEKYPGSSAVPVMQGDGPTSATVRISPR
jgi:hypothetical protein